MKTNLVSNIVSEKELFFMYNQIISSPTWKMNGLSEPDRGFMSSPVLIVKEYNDSITHYPFYIWGQTIVYRIAKILESKNIGIPTTVERMWFNCTYHGKKTQHWLHRDDEKDPKLKSILLFMTPIWQPDWRGSFYIDGEEFKFKPGNAIVFDSNEYHKGESPASETYNWQRICCNIIVG
jgi:hypothetical protein